MPTDFRVPRAKLNGVDPRDKVDVAIGSFWPDITCDELDRIASGTPGQRNAYVTLLLAREVDNGGLKQFFWNSSSELYPFICPALLELGALDRHATLLQAAKFFGPSPTLPPRPIRQAKLNALSRTESDALFDPLDDAMYGPEKGLEEYIRPLLLNLLETHPADFFLD